MSFRPLVSGLQLDRPSHCGDSSSLGLRVQLEPELPSSILLNREGSLQALGNHFSLLLGQRSVDMQREIVDVLPQRGDKEMYLVLHQSGYEVYISRQAI